MKSLIAILALWAIPASASTVRLNDSAILGEYELVQANANAEIQKAQIIFNNDNQLVVWTERNESEYVTSTPDADGVIVSEEGEPNVGSGDEPSCWYDVTTVMSLEIVGGAPQLTIKLAQDDAYDESGDSYKEETFVLRWARTLPHQIPFYLNAEHPAALQAVVDQCEATLKPTLGSGVYSASSVCGIVSSYTYRDDLKTALEYFFKNQTSKQVEELKATDLQSKIFPAVEDVVAKLDEKKLKVAKSTLLSEVKNLEAAVLKGDKFYYYQFANYAVVFTVDTTAKTITSYMLNSED